MEGSGSTETECIEGVLDIESMRSDETSIRLKRPKVARLYMAGTSLSVSI